MAEIPHFIAEGAQAPGLDHFQERLLMEPSEAASKLGDQLDEFTNQYIAAKNMAAKNDAVLKAGTGLQSIQDSAATIPDREKALAQYDQQSTDYLQSTLQGISNPLVRLSVQDDLTRQVLSRREQVGHQSYGLEVGSQRDSLDANLAGSATAFAAAPDPVTRAHVMDDALNAIHGSVAAGIITPGEGELKVNAFNSSAAEVALKQDRNAVLANRDPLDAMAFEKKVSDPANYPGLLPEVRENFIKEAETTVYSLSQEQLARATHAIALADKALADHQRANAADLWGSALAGNPIDNAALAEKVRTQQISPEQANAVLSIKAGRDDPQAQTALFDRIYQGQATDADVVGLVAQGRLTGGTAVSALKALTEYNKEGGGMTAAAKGYYETLKTAVGPGSDPFAPIDDSTKQRWAAAQADWTNRVVVGHENPRSVMVDLLAQYSTASAPPLATPMFGAIAEPKDVLTAAAATRQAYAAGRISQAQFADQAQILQDWGRFYQDRATRQNAIKAATSQPKPAPGQSAPDNAAPPPGGF